MRNQEVEKLNNWLISKLRFVNKNIQDAQDTKNYGKEIQFASMKEAYQELLAKLQKEFAV